MKLRPHLALLAVVLVWGTTFSLVKSALADCPPLLFNLLRMALATAALLALNIRTLRALPAATWRLAAAAGIFLALGYQFQTAGLARTTPSKSAFITGLVVVFVPLLSLIAKLRPHEARRPHPAAIAGALLAFAGLVFLTTSPHAPLFSGFTLGDALTLVCALSFAAHLLTLARVTPATGARALGTLQIAVATAVMLFTLPLERAPLHVNWTPRLILALLITGLLATAAAFTIQSWAQKHIAATHTALIFTLEPVFAALTATIFLHEHMDPRQTAGAALILAGILLAELLPALRSPSPIPSP